MTLREAWTSHVTAEDYERHMASIGQAQANAELVAFLFAQVQIEPGARVLLAGAGTGQMFDFLPPLLFDGYRVLASDVNPTFLAKLRERIDYETAIDDIEDSRLAPGFGAIIVVLVLEHVDWRRAVASLTRLRPDHLILVIQENPPGMAAAVTPGRTPAGTMRVFAGQARPHLVPAEELAAELAKAGFIPEASEQRAVADGKHMAGLSFAPQS
jgi:SAM-dependent methyltransferase